MVLLAICRVAEAAAVAVGATLAAGLLTPPLAEHFWGLAIVVCAVVLQVAAPVLPETTETKP